MSALHPRRASKPHKKSTSKLAKESLTIGQAVTEDIQSLTRYLYCLVDILSGQKFQTVRLHTPQFLYFHSLAAPCDSIIHALLKPELRPRSSQLETPQKLRARPDYQAELTTLRTEVDALQTEVLASCDILRRALAVAGYPQQPSSRKGLKGYAQAVQDFVSTRSSPVFLAYYRRCTVIATKTLHDLPAVLQPVPRNKFRVVGWVVLATVRLFRRRSPAVVEQGFLEALL